MTPRAKDEEPLRQLIRDMINKQEEQNKEVRRLAVTVFGDKDADINGLVGDNRDNKQYIATNKKLIWMVSGIMLFLTAFKTSLLKLIGL